MDPIKKVLMMDAGTILFYSSAGFGPNLGQLRKELEQIGKVIPLVDMPQERLPDSLKGYDFLVDLSNFFCTRYLSVRIADSGATGKNDPEGREIRRYALEFLLTPCKKTHKALLDIKKKYRRE